MPSAVLVSWSLPWLGAALLGVCGLHSLLLWQGHLKEKWLGHVLAAGLLQGLGILACLACSWPEPIPPQVNGLLLLGAGYGLWALRAYAGFPARMNRWGGLALGAWVLVALAFHAMGFRWVRGFVVPATLGVLALGMSRDLGRLPQGRGIKAPAQVCAGLAILLAFGALGAGLTSAAFLAGTGVYTPLVRAWFFFGILVVHQVSVLLLAQVQGQRLQTRLVGLVATDPATGLASAKGFQDRLDRAVGRSLRTGKVTSLLILDLDGYEAMVLEHGPTQAARILEAFAVTMNATLREADLSGRLEGGRFAALLHQTPPMEAMLAAERLRSTWENVALNLGAQAVRATLSGGVASTREPIEGAGALLSLAMVRALSARNGGGNNVEGEVQVYASLEAN
jgi:diguanylate cyclase (GGDEF)-like protein